MNAPHEAGLVVRRSLNCFLALLFVAVVSTVGCGGGGGGSGSSTPGGGGSTSTPKPTGAIQLNAVAAIVPNALPNPSATAPPVLPSANFASGLSTGQFVYSAAGRVTYNAGAPPLTVTDNDTSGSSCLVYEAAGASSATPCPFASAASSVTLNSVNDSYAVLYNGKFLPGGALTISAPSVTSLTVSIAPTTIAIGPTIAFTGGDTPIGAIAYDSSTSEIFVAITDPSNPLYVVPYSLS